jgi:hypothetical protein
MSYSLVTDKTNNMQRQHIYTKLLCCTLALYLLSACKKEALITYDAGARIYIDNDRGVDSITYSFATKNSSLIRDTIWLPVRTMGTASNKDRVINLKVVDTLTTAQQGVHYELMPYIMPAGQYVAKLGVIVKKAADLETKQVSIGLRLQESADFQPGTGDGLDYQIRINNILTKPGNWDPPTVPGPFLAAFFGPYSEVKFRFIIDVLEMSEFVLKGPGALPYSQFLYFQQRMKNALEAYNALHPGNPMKDEFGNLVNF